MDKVLRAGVCVHMCACVVKTLNILWFYACKMRNRNGGEGKMKEEDGERKRVRKRGEKQG